MVHHWYGSQEMLGAPLDRGFNRLAWMLPYILGVGGIGVLGLVAIRWSRRPHTSESASADVRDPEVDERLDDELRNLD